MCRALYLIVVFLRWENIYRTEFMRIIYLVLLNLILGCSSQSFISYGRADFTYESPKQKITGSEKDHPGHWARDLYIKNSDALMLQPGYINKISKGDDEVISVVLKHSPLSVGGNCVLLILYIILL